MSEKIVQLNEEVIKGQIKELVRGSVEETLNELLEQEAEKLTQAARYERNEARQGYRSGHYDRNLTTTSGDVTLHVPRLKGVSFETAIIERYRRRESSVEEALIEMYLAGVSVRRVEDITEALWGSKVTINEAEADTVRKIAEQYLSGKSLKAIAEMLAAKHIEYMSGKTDWNRSRIKRIVEDKRYIGDGGYLPILTEQEYAAMQSIKAAKNTQKDVNHTEGIFTLNAPVICPNCGGRMHRRFDRRRKATTWWQCSECKASVNISDEDMLDGITELLNEVIANPESIKIPKSDHEESQEIERLNAEISKALNTFDFDKEALKQKMLTCVSEKYTSLGTEEITAQSLKDIFKTVPPLTAYDSNLTDQAVSEIQLKRNGTISLVLINGQRIGKEKSA